MVKPAPVVYDVSAVVRVVLRQKWCVLPLGLWVWRVRKRWRKVKPTLRSRYQFPTEDGRIDNKSIIHGFRSDRSCFSCLCSMCELHNETCNIWTHLLPALYYVPYCSPRWHPATRLVALAGSSLFAMSTVAHTFCANSMESSKLLFQLDKAMIAVFGWSASSSVAYLSLTRSGETRALRCVLTVMTVLMVWCFKQMMKTAATPEEATANRSQIVKCFMVQYSVGALLAARELLTNPDPTIKSIVLEHLVKCVGSGLLGGALFASSVPESIWPGQFDCFGNSHNLMHVAVAFSTYYAHRGLSRWCARVLAGGSAV